MKTATPLKFRLVPWHLAAVIQEQAAATKNGGWVMTLDWVPTVLDLEAPYTLAFIPPADEVGWRCPFSRDATADELHVLEVELQARSGGDSPDDVAAYWCARLSAALMATELLAQFTAVEPGRQLARERVEALVLAVENLGDAFERATAPWVAEAVEFITQAIGAEGEHHKQWALDQAARLLMGPENYAAFRAHAGPDYDEGIAP